MDTRFLYLMSSFIDGVSEKTANLLP